MMLFSPAFLATTISLHCMGLHEEETKLIFTVLFVFFLKKSLTILTCRATIYHINDMSYDDITEHDINKIF